MARERRTVFEYLDFVPRERFRPTLAISPDGTTVAYSSNCLLYTSDAADE